MVRYGVVWYGVKYQPPASPTHPSHDSRAHLLFDGLASVMALSAIRIWYLAACTSFFALLISDTGRSLACWAERQPSNSYVSRRWLLQVGARVVV